MQVSNFPTPISSTCNLLLGDASGLAILASCTGTPPTTANVFQVSCKIIQTNQTTGSFAFSNTGTAALPVWTQDLIPNGIATGTGLLNVAHAIYSFAVDGGAIGAITPVSTATIPANAIIVGATVNSTTTVTSAGAATVSIGTVAGSSASSILAATAKTSFTLDALLNGVPVFATPVKMTAAGAINITVATAALTAGIIEVFAYYTVAANA